MNADSAFIIGATHAVCQDYAVAGTGLPQHRAPDKDAPAAPYVILSDGCSSSPDTDIGARLLVKAAEQTLAAAAFTLPAGDLAGAHREAARRALSWAETAGVPPEAVDATLLTAHLSGDELILGCSGDGVIVLESRTGVTDVYVISYASGYPLYPSYAHQPERLRALEDSGLTGKEVQRFRAASAGVPLRLEEMSTRGGLTEVFAVRARDYRQAVILSDGIHSFFTPALTETSKRVEAVPVGEVLTELISFKSVRGRFVRRRLGRFVKECQTRGWHRADDLAVGALHTGD